jgi:YgiT-type zinc finger domain-containing protein
MVKGHDMRERAERRPCPECGGEMRYEERDDTLEYKGHTRTIKTLDWWCRRCGEGVLTGEPLVASERAFLELKAEVDVTVGA